VSPLAEAILRELSTEPKQFAELVDAHRDAKWRDFLRAWGEVRGADVLTRDEDGRYLIKSA